MSITANASKVSTKTYKAFEIKSKHGIDELALSERSTRAPGEHEVLVEMRAASLNYRDLLVTKGTYGALDLPRVPLSDGVGVVVEVGPSCTRVKPGDRVAGIFMQTWLHGDVKSEYSHSALGGAIDGVLAQYVLYNEEGLVKVPEHLSDEEAATLPCAGVTAWNALFVEGGVKAGDTVVIQGTGGVSLFALQFSKLAGATTIVTSSSDEKLKKAKALGADHLINYKKTPDWDKEVFAITGKHGADHIVEVGGAGTFNKSLNAVRVGGHVELIGVLTGVAADISTVHILHKAIRVHGIYVGSRDMFEDMNKAIAQSKLKPVIDKVFKFEQIKEALHYMESQAHFGKIAIKF